MSRGAPSNTAQNIAEERQSERESTNVARAPLYAEQWRPPHNPYLIAVTVSLATFMEVLDTSITNVALPHIAGNLSAGVDESTWVVTSYLVSNAIVLPLSGWFSALLGRKRFYMICVVLFTVTSVLCGFAPNLTVLVIGRILQGIGGGGLAPSEQAILVDSFPREKHGQALAIYGIPVLVAPILGPVLGGWITDNYTWRWIFFINIPVGILSLILTSRLVSDPPWMQRQKRTAGAKVDYLGISFLALGLGALQIVLDKGEREDWFASYFIVWLSVLAVVGVIGTVLWELRQKEPAVEVRLLAERNFLIGNCLMFTLGFVLYSTTLLLPLFLQTLMGYTAVKSGLALSPGGMVTLLLAPVVGGILVPRVDARWLFLCGLLVVALALFQMASFSLDIDYRTAVLARMFQCFALPFLFIPSNTIAMAYIPREKSNSGTALINLSRNLGGSVGIAVVTTLLARRVQVHQALLVSHLTPYDWQYRAALHGATQVLLERGVSAGQAAAQAQGMLYRLLVRQATMLAFVDNFRILGMAALAVIPLVFLIKKVQPGQRAEMGH